MNAVRKAKLLLFLRLFGESLCLPYLSLFLSGKGFTQAQIGIIIGLIPLTALACTPLYAKIFDTPKKVKTALSVMGLIEAALVVCLLFFNDDFAVVIALVVLISITSSSNYGLLDSFLGLICTQNGKTFGTVRVFGSIAYMIGSFGAGLVAEAVSYELTFSIAAGLYVAVSILFAFTKAPAREDGGAARTTVGSVLTDKKFMGYVLFYVLFIGSMQVCDDFYSLYLVSKGNPDYYYSFVMLGFIAVEIVTMLLMNKFAKPDLKYLFIACGVLAARLAIQSVPQLPTWALIASQISRGVTWGITLYVSTPFIIKILGFERSTSGIVLCWFFLSVFTSVFKLCGGYLISAIGYPYFYLIFAVTVTADLIYLVFYRRAVGKTLPLNENRSSPA